MNDRAVILVPGIRTKPGDTVGKLAPTFRDAGYDVREIKTGYRRFLFDAGKRDKWANVIASAILKYRGRHVLLIGHSDGDLLNQLALDRVESRLPPASLIRASVNGALDVDAPRHDVVDRWDVYHDPDDGWLKFARLIWWHRWGALGRRGHDLGIADDPMKRRIIEMPGPARAKAIKDGRLDPAITNINIGDGRNGWRDHVSAFDNPGELAARIGSRHRHHLLELAKR